MYWLGAKFFLGINRLGLEKSAFQFSRAGTFSFQQVTFHAQIVCLLNYKKKGKIRQVCNCPREAKVETSSSQRSWNSRLFYPLIKGGFD